MRIKSKKSNFIIFAVFFVAIAGSYITFKFKMPTQNQRKLASASMSDPSCNFGYFDRANLLTMSQGNMAGSITDIIKFAPDCFKQNQVSIYNSESLHCSTFKAPRMILYMNDDIHGNSVCSFNSGVKDDYADFYQKNPNADCHEDTLECESFNPNNNRFEFFEVKDGTKTGTKGFTVSNVNPSQCMTCHRGTEYLGTANPRPNLENYPGWPGFYGSMHDNFNATPSEKDHYFADYLKYKPQNLRYSALPNVVDAKTGYYTGDNSKPAVNLQNLLAGQNQQRIAAEFTSPDALKQTWPFRYAILGALACDDDLQTYDNSSWNAIPPQRKFEIESFLPDVLRSKVSITFAKLTSAALQAHQQNLQKLMGIQKQQGIVTFSQFIEDYSHDMNNDPSKSYQTYTVADADDFWNGTRLAYIAQNLGLPADDWSMTFGQTFDFEAGDRNIKQVLPLVAPWLIDKVEDQDMKLSLETRLGISPDPAQCNLLRTKSLKALASISAWPQPGSSSQVPIYQGPPQRLSSCIGCHVIGSAPHIPYNDPTLLKQAFATQATTDPGKTLFQEIFYRLDSGSMPPNAALSDTDRTALESYFNKIQSQ